MGQVVCPQRESPARAPRLQRGRPGHDLSAHGQAYRVFRPLSYHIFGPLSCSHRPVRGRLIDVRRTNGSPIMLLRGGPSGR